jgi:hypothetical protein
MNHASTLYGSRARFRPWCVGSVGALGSDPILAFPNRIRKSRRKLNTGRRISAAAASIFQPRGARPKRLRKNSGNVSFRGAACPELSEGSDGESLFFLASCAQRFLASPRREASVRALGMTTGKTLSQPTVKPRPTELLVRNAVYFACSGCRTSFCTRQLVISPT